MSSGPPADRGLRNGFGWSRMTNPNQPTFQNEEEDRIWAAPNTLLNDDGLRSLPPMRYTPTVPPGTLVATEDLFNLRSNNRRRRSSSLSPRSTRPPAYQASNPYANSFPYQLPTPSSSNNFSANQTIHRQVAVGADIDSVNAPSISTISGSTRTSTTSANTVTPSTIHDRNQRAVLSLLSGICTEALRRRWQDDIQRRSIRSLTSRRSPSSQHRQRPRSRRSPYVPFSTHPAPHFYMHPQTATTEQHQPLRFMELMQRVATAMWENVTQPSPPQPSQSPAPGDQTQAAIDPPSIARLAVAIDPLSRARHTAALAPARATAVTDGASKTAAIDSMRLLYSLGNNIIAAAAATQTARAGQSFSDDEIRDIVVDAVAFCRFLGYHEGAQRCEELVVVNGRGGAIGWSRPPSMADGVLGGATQQQQPPVAPRPPQWWEMTLEGERGGTVL